MRSTKITLSAFLFVVVVGCGGSPTSGRVGAEAGNKDKIVGTWEVTIKGEYAGGSVEFTKDGKMTMKMGAITMEGTYSVDEDSLKVDTKGPDGRKMVEKWKIKKLTDKELVTEEKRDGKTETTEYRKK
jgi:uncharacterized protein (TIGR03066 family)